MRVRTIAFSVSSATGVGRSTGTGPCRGRRDPERPEGRAGGESDFEKGAPVVASVFLVARPGAPSSVLASSKARSQGNI